MKGTVKFFDSIKGFGFVKGEDDTEYFVHQTALEPGTRLNDDDHVEFEPTQGDRGPKAEKVKKVEAPAAANDNEPLDDEPEAANDNEPLDDEVDLEELNKEQPAA